MTDPLPAAIAFGIGMLAGVLLLAVLLTLWLVVSARRLAARCEPGDDVHLSAGGERVQLRPPATAATFSTEPQARSVSGLVIPWNVPGMTSLGALLFPSGVVELPADLSRVKLAIGHTGEPDHTVVGYATAAETRPDGLYMTFTVPAGADGDRAMADARNRLRDGLSAEVHALRRTGQRVTGGILTAVSLVPVPAYSDARVSLSAPTTPIGVSTMDAQALFALLLRSGLTATAARAAVAEQFGADAAAGVTEPATEPATPPAPAEPASPAAPQSSPVTLPPATGDASAAAPVPAAAGAAHFGIVTPQHAGGAIVRPRGLSVQEASVTLRAIQTGETVSHAALADITGATLASAEPPQWLGEVWQANPQARQIVPLLHSEALRSSQLTGWRWVNRPMVAAYSGNKTEIPSNTVSIAPVTAPTVRWAGGHDLDRKFYDFGMTDVLTGYWTAMAESYAIVTDNAAGAALVAGATPVAAPLQARVTDLLSGMLAAKSAVFAATRAPLSFILANTMDAFGLLGLTVQEQSAYLGLLGIDPSRIVWTDQVPEGTLIAGARPAVTWFELPGSPLRVEAEHVALGGRDAALFGYSGILIRQPAGIVSVDISGE